MSQEIYTYFLIPLLITFARIVDVSLGTVRVILVTKGSKLAAPLLGFFEVIIWLLAIGQVMQNLTTFTNYIAYGLGFALGNYFGIIIEQKLALGIVAVRIITQFDASNLINHLKEMNYGITVLDAEGSNGPVSVIFTIIKRSNLTEIIPEIKKFNPNAFYSVEDIRLVSEAFIKNNNLSKKHKIYQSDAAKKGK